MTDLERKRQLARDRQRRRRERLRFERRVTRHMERYGVDRAQAIAQLTPVGGPRVGGPARGWEPTRRPRNRWRVAGTTPEAARRRAFLRRRAHEERRRERLEEREERTNWW